MPMKILTGQIVTRSGNRSRGTATIDFDPHGVVAMPMVGAWQQQAAAALTVLLVLFLH